MANEGTFPKSGGDILYSSEVNEFNLLGGKQSAADIELNNVYSGAGLAEKPYTELAVDVISEASGANLSVSTNTGSTTSYFYTSNYSYTNAFGVSGAAVNDANGVNQDTTDTGANDYGVQVSPNFDIEVISIDKSSDCNAATARILNSAAGLIKSASFSTDTATFTPPVILLSGGTYYFTAYGTPYTSDRGETTFPIADTNFDWVEGKPSSATTLYNIASAVTKVLTPGNTVLQTTTDFIALGSAPDGYKVTAEVTKSGTSHAYYDISFDAGSNYTTDNAFDTIYGYEGAGSNPILKFQLSGVGIGNRCDLHDYTFITTI